MNNYLSRLVLALVLSAVAAVSIAGEGIPLGLREAMEYAAAHRPDLWIVGKEEERAQASVNEAKGLFLPSLNLSGDVGRNTGLNHGGTVSADVNGQPVNVTIGGGDAGRQSTVAVEAALNLYSGGAHQARLAQAQAQLRDARAQQEARRKAAMVEVATAYFALRKAQLELKRASQLASFAQEQASMLTVECRAGKISRIERLTKALKVAESKNRLSLAWTERSRLWYRYLLALGMNPAGYRESEPVMLQDDVNVARRIGPAAANEQVPPDIVRARAEYDATQAAVRTANAEYLPRIDLFARRTFANSNDGFNLSGAGPRVAGAMIGVRLQWNFFDGFQSGARRDRSLLEVDIKRMAIQQRELEWGNTLQEQRRQIVKLENARDMALQRLAVVRARTDVDRQRLALDEITQLLYRSSLVEFADAAYEVAMLQVDIDRAYVELEIQQGVLR